jgi:hypothetical protein
MQQEVMLIRQVLQPMSRSNRWEQYINKRLPIASNVGDSNVMVFRTEDDSINDGIWIQLNVQLEIF